jgi:UDP-N-acetylmuramyl pentapeptide phosphotransferase/UDP-N-acetylglucosamine-1-phosphate transferase
MFYLIIFISLLVLELIYFRIAHKFGIVDKPNERSSHKVVTMRGGGIIFYLGALLFFLTSGMQYPWFFAGLTLISLLSFVDDIHSLPPRLRLVLQFVAMLVMFQQLHLFTLDTWWVIIVALIICTGAVDVYNFMDGINGITGGYSLVVVAALAYVNYYDEFVNPDLLRIIALALIVFCLFNFRRHARCFAGDIGSVSIAFIIIFILGLQMLKTNDFSWLTFLVVYGVDGCLTIIHRLMLHENITHPHRKHAFQIMANELKIPHVVVSLIYMFIQAIMCIWYIEMPGYITLFLSIALLSIAYVIFMKKYYHLHKG